MKRRGILTRISDLFRGKKRTGKNPELIIIDELHDLPEMAMDGPEFEERLKRFRERMAKAGKKH